MLKREWEMPQLIALDGFEHTLQLKGVTNAYEIHCTSPTASISNTIYSATTSGLPIAAACNRKR